MAGYGYFGGLSDFLKKWLEQRGDTSWSDKQVAKGEVPGGVDLFNTAYDEYSRRQSQQFQMDMYREDRAWQEDLYERYQSIGGQIDQMRQNGINPAMMYANGSVNAPAVSSGQIPSAPSGSGGIAGSAIRNQTALDKASGIFQMIASFLGVGSNIGQSISQMVRNKTMNERDDAQAANFDADTDLKKEQERGMKLSNDMSEIKLQSYDVMVQLSMDKTRSEIAKNASEFWRNNSEIYVNSTLAELNKANATKAQLQCGTELLNWISKGLEIEKQQKLLPLAVEFEQARINLLEAQAVESTSKTSLLDAQTNYYNAMSDFQEALIEAGAPEEQVKQMEASRKQSWVTVICGGICQMIMASLGIVSATKGKGNGAKGTIGFDGNTSMSVDYGNMNLM